MSVFTLNLFWTHAAVSSRRGACLSLAMACVVMLLASVAGAYADQLRVDNVQYLAGSGAIAATVRAAGPLDTALAADLYRGRCPFRAAEEDTQPGVSADDRPHLLLANPPTPGQSGTFELCVWTIHDDGAIGARYRRQVLIPMPTSPAWDPALGTSHPWWWALAGWGVPVCMLALLWVAVRRWRGKPGLLTGLQRRILGPRLRRAERCTPGAKSAPGEADAGTLELAGVGERAASGAVVGSSPEDPARPGPISEHPFVPPPHGGEEAGAPGEDAAGAR